VRHYRIRLPPWVKKRYERGGDRVHSLTGVTLMVAERARAPIIELRYRLRRYFARYAPSMRSLI